MGSFFLFLIFFFYLFCLFRHPFYMSVRGFLWIKFFIQFAEVFGKFWLNESKSDGFIRLDSRRSFSTTYGSQRDKYDFFNKFFSSDGVVNWGPHKNHQHQIILQYKPRHIRIKENGFMSKAIMSIDKYFSTVPFYFSLVISIGGLLLLFFIFLHYYKVITLCNVIKIGVINFLLPVNYGAFSMFYGSLFFYIFLFFHSFVKFCLHLFDEIRCIYIYTPKVHEQYLLGISLFIVSEIMLFFSFFWAFFHCSLSPSIFIGNVWPPLGIVTLNPWQIPFLNTVILLSSGVTVNWFFFSLRRMSYLNCRLPSSIGRVHEVLSPILDIFMSVFNFFFVFIKLKDVKKDLILERTQLNFFFRNSFVYRSVLVYSSVFLFSIFVCLWYLVLRFFGSCKVHTVKSLIVLFLSVSLRWITFLVYSFYFCGSEIWNSFFLIVFCCLDSFFLDKLKITRSVLDIFLSLIVTVYMGVLFLGFQYCEYTYYASFDIKNIYGTVFYMLTMLHGFHVFVGLLSLLLCYSYFSSFRFIRPNLNRCVFYNVLTIFAVWYWHFVDVVWLFLFVIVYVWGS